MGAAALRDPPRALGGGGAAAHQPLPRVLEGPLQPGLQAVVRRVEVQLRLPVLQPHTTTWLLWGEWTEIAPERQSRPQHGCGAPGGRGAHPMNHFSPSASRARCSGPRSSSPLPSSNSISWCRTSPKEKALLLCARRVCGGVAGGCRRWAGRTAVGHRRPPRRRALPLKNQNTDREYGRGRRCVPHLPRCAQPTRHADRGSSPHAVGAEPSRPLLHPCKCTGSIRYVHETCLRAWLDHSNKRRCDLCGVDFVFEASTPPHHHPPTRPPRVCAPPPLASSARLTRGSPQAVYDASMPRSLPAGTLLRLVARWVLDEAVLLFRYALVVVVWGLVLPLVVRWASGPALPPPPPQHLIHGAGVAAVL